MNLPDDRQQSQPTPDQPATVNLYPGNTGEPPREMQRAHSHHLLSTGARP
jgi:hypothetical protein